MAYVPVANVAEVEMRMRLAGQSIENTLYFQFASGPSSAELTALGGDMRDWWIASYAPLVSSLVQLVEVNCTDLTTATGPQVGIAVTDEFGTGGSNALSNNVALCVSFRTTMRGRSFRGRNYISGIDRTQLVDSNTFETSYATSVHDAYNAINSALSVSADWVIVSRFSGMGGTPRRPIPRAAGLATLVTSVVIVDRTVDSMRRRLPGRGT